VKSGREAGLGQKRYIARKLLFDLEPGLLARYALFVHWDESSRRSSCLVVRHMPIPETVSNMQQ